MAKLSTKLIVVLVLFTNLLQLDLTWGQDKSKPERVNSGLILLYDFQEPTKNLVADETGIKPPVTLKVETPEQTERSSRELKLKGKALIKSENIAPRIAASIIQSGELTLEAWIHPANVTQKGPARIFTYSRNSNDRNFTIGQNGNSFDFRVRSTKTSNNGLPSLATQPGSATPELTHLVYTRDRTGLTRIYINGQVNVEKKLAGDLTNWTADFPIAIANEMTSDRPWNGKINLLAVYQRDLLPHEVQRNFNAGPKASTRHVVAPDLSQDLFVSKVAPIIAKRCLECHTADNKEGGLDLSNKRPAMAGGDSGEAILPNKPYDSSFWTMVVSNEMPKNRDTLKAEEKEILKQWIDSGAKWTHDSIDPADFESAHSNQPKRAYWVRRLTVNEYIATVKATTGVDIRKQAREILPADLRADGFKNTAYNLTVDLKHVESYARLAESIVAKLDIEEFASQFFDQNSDKETRTRELIARMGKLFFRSPLEDHELATYLQVATTVEKAGGEFNEAASFIAEAMLQSPRFIYQIENQRGDGTRWPVGHYELASRMSYILWGAPPDKALMDSVDRGELYDRTEDSTGSNGQKNNTRSVIEIHVERMLKDPQAQERSIEFVSQWLDLDRLDNIQPNREMFPEWDMALARDMQAETKEYFKSVVWTQKRPLVEILSTPVTFVTPRLAKHYGLDPKNVIEGSEQNDTRLSKFDLAAVPGRGGILSHGSVLTMGGDEASMVTRGLFVLQGLLRGSVKDPPPCVDTSTVPTKEGLTQRKIAEARIANANCGGCHSKFEPLAFGLERFDGLGTYREKDEHGNKLRDDGEILFPGSANSIKYKNLDELVDLLVKNDRVSSNLTWKVTQFALGRPLTASDTKQVQKIHRQSQTEGGTYQSLMKAIIMSDLVQTTLTERSKK